MPVAQGLQGAPVAGPLGVEGDAALAQDAARRLRELGCDNVKVRHGDGSEGWSEHAPYDAIVVAAASPHVPGALREQLHAGGRLVIPVGGRWSIQRLIRERRAESGEFTREELGAVRFVPITEAEYRREVAPA